MAREHRKPPEPPHLLAPRGLCRLCGDFTSDGPRWHKRCAFLWNIASDPAFARKFVFARDGGVCADCGHTDARLNGDWDVDHDVPLRDAPRTIEHWMPEKLRTRCRPCHNVKTTLENAARKRQRATAHPERY